MTQPRNFGRNPETQYRADPADSADKPAPPADPAAQQLLDLVLQQTMASFAKSQGSDTHAREALRNVAEQYAGAPLSFEPCLVALVEASIREPFSQWVSPGPAWDALCRRVALTMYDDPTARARLENLWRQLQEDKA